MNQSSESGEPLRLVADASAFVAELLRNRGRDLIEHPRLNLLIAVDTQTEADHELRRRVAIIAARRTLPAREAQTLLDETLDLMRANVTVVPAPVYDQRRIEARARMARDPDDAPALALALTLDCGIWTADRDFFGCGAPVWSTETLLWYVGSHRS